MKRVGSTRNSRARTRRLAYLSECSFGRGLCSRFHALPLGPKSATDAAPHLGSQLRRSLTVPSRAARPVGCGEHAFVHRPARRATGPRGPSKSRRQFASSSSQTMALSALLGSGSQPVSQSPDAARAPGSRSAMVASEAASLLPGSRQSQLGQGARAPTSTTVRDKIPAG